MEYDYKAINEITTDPYLVRVTYYDYCMEHPEELGFKSKEEIEPLRVFLRLVATGEYRLGITPSVLEHAPPEQVALLNRLVQHFQHINTKALYKGLSVPPYLKE